LRFTSFFCLFFTSVLNYFHSIFLSINKHLPCIVLSPFCRVAWLFRFNPCSARWQCHSLFFVYPSTSWSLSLDENCLWLFGAYCSSIFKLFWKVIIELLGPVFLNVYFKHIIFFNVNR
jgi:hypothetical protein